MIITVTSCYLKILLKLKVFYQKKKENKKKRKNFNVFRQTFITFSAGGELILKINFREGEKFFLPSSSQFENAYKLGDGRRCTANGIFSSDGFFHSHADGGKKCRVRKEGSDEMCGGKL